MKAAVLALSFLLTGFFCCAGWSSAPDDWGYRYETSDDAGGPAFEWRDISGVGQQVILLDDDNEGPFNLGFQFLFYGQTYSDIHLCSNGWLSFTSGSHQFHNFNIPCTREPNCLVAPFWTDLDPSNGGSVFVYEGSGEFVASWLGVPHRHGLEPYSFQTVLLDDGSVLFQYLEMADTLHLDSSSVGIENGAGEIGSSLSFNGMPEGAIKDGLAVRFFTVTHDVNPIVIHYPLETQFASVPCNPTVSIKNYGSASESPLVVCTILDWSTGLPVYADSVAASLGPRDTVLVSFEDWVPADGHYRVRFLTLLPTNDDAGLDTLDRSVRVSSHGYMAHDDGVVDRWYIVSGSPTSTMGVAARYTPPYAPYHVIRGRILVSSTMPFEKVYLSPDDGTGKPDLGNPYAISEWVKADSDTAWARVEFDASIASGDDVWLTAIWPKGAVSPMVGEDATPPIDSCSFYTVYPPVWYLRGDGDWMMRLEIDDNVGVPDRVAQSRQTPVLSCAPNPFRSSTSITVSGGDGRVAVCDVAGRVVRHLGPEPARRLAYTVTWDGRDGLGRPLPSGTYFVTASGTEGIVARNLILAK